jgi:hypothetical protein
MWIKLKVSKVIKHEKYGIGDWADVGTDLALQWISANHAEALNFDGVLAEEGIGIVYPPSSRAPIIPVKSIPMQESGLTPCFPRSLILNAPYSIQDRDSPNLLRNIGQMAFIFELLKQWDVVLILSSFTVNASKVGTEAERELTGAIVHDLRVPYYQQCAFGVQNNQAGQDFCAVLAEERGNGKALAALRALYRVQPMAYYVSPEWGRKEV